MYISRDSKRLVYNVALSENELRTLAKLFGFIESLLNVTEFPSARRFIKDFLSEVQLLLGPNKGRGE